MVNMMLPSFDTTKDLVELSSEWPKWKRAFEYFIETKRIVSAEQKCAFLLHSGGMGLQEIFANLPETKQETEGESEDDENEDQNEYEKAILKLDNYFCIKRNITVERYIFRNIRQLSDEAIEQYVIRLRRQLNRCDFGSLSDEQLRDQLIEGTNSDKLREKALLKNTITLAELLELGQTLEATKANLRNLKNGREATFESINYVAKNRYSSENGRNFQKKRRQDNDDTNQMRKKFNSDMQNSQSKRKCFRCGNEDHLSYDQNCPAKKKICDRCSRIGHYKKMCRTNLSKSTETGGGKTKSSTAVRNIEDETDRNFPNMNEESTNEYVFHIGSDQLNSTKYKCEIGGVPITLIIDSGSEVNVIDCGTWENLKRQRIVIISNRKGSEKKLRGYGSSKPLSIIGEFCAKIKSTAKEVDATFYVVKEPGAALLGRITSINLGILKIGDVNSVEEFTGKIKNVLVDIPIDSTVSPISQPYRRVPIPLEAKVNKKIGELLDQVS